MGVFMKFSIDHDLHIHSFLSSCSSDPQQTPEAILEYAKCNNLKTICITNHYWDDAVEGASNWYRAQNFDHIKQCLPLPQSKDCKFLFGCETDMNRFLKIGIPKERFDDFDFIIVPTTHLHMNGFTYLPEEDNVKDKTRLYIERFEAFLQADLPFEKVGIAHLTCGLIFNNGKDDRYVEVLDGISDEKFYELFKKCSELGCGIELNISLSALQNEKIKDSIFRPYRIAKDCGCKFYLGSDSHHPSGFDEAMLRFEKMVETLCLTEDDKFILK